jgi:uncharacterized membrane protein YoaK (UPF0700 family)
MKLAFRVRSLGCENLSLACLSLAAGCTDVLSFLKLGDLFTSAMTGNTALLAIAIGRGQLLAASRSLCALLGFTLGVALATVLYAPWHTHPNARCGLRRLLLLEIVFLGGCTVLWSASPDPIRGGALYAVILLSALSMGIQAVGARSINSAGISTIVFTTPLVNVVMSATGALARSAAATASPASAAAHLGTFTAYGCGAALAAFPVSHYLGALIWVPVAAVLLALGFSELAGRLEKSEASLSGSSSANSRTDGHHPCKAPN